MIRALLALQIVYKCHNLDKKKLASNSIVSITKHCIKMLENQEMVPQETNSLNHFPNDAKAKSQSTE